MFQGLSKSILAFMLRRFDAAQFGSTRKPNARSARQPQEYFAAVFVLVFASMTMATNTMAEDLASATSSTDFLDVKIAGDQGERYLSQLRLSSLQGYALRPPKFGSSPFYNVARVVQFGNRNSFAAIQQNSSDSFISSVQIGEENAAFAGIFNSPGSSIVQQQVGRQNTSAIGIIGSQDTSVLSIQIGEGLTNRLFLVGQPGTKLFVLSAGKN